MQGKFFLTRLGPAKYQPMNLQKLFNLMAAEHGLLLTEDQLKDIWYLVQTEIDLVRNGALLDALISQAQQTAYETRIDIMGHKESEYLSRIVWQEHLTPEAHAVLVAGGRITNEQ